MAEPPSSPPTGDTSSEDALAWYKSQYEQLELELADFRESSKELEAELEKDLDAADKRERALQGKAETLGFEVEEWKSKYRESKAEANAAQNTLEKEVTSLRDSNRTLQLKLRDIEVANDDYARQARNTTSSLDDLESKYNVAIERAVLLEEEIRMGEQERENLRIESQRLKDELSDLKVEAEILQGKVKKMEEDNRIRDDEEQNDPHHLSVISTDLSMLESPTFDRSPDSTSSSPLITTPPDSKPPTVSGETHGPPSPPMSDASAPAPPASSLLSAKPKGAPFKTPVMPKKSRLPSADHSVTPKPSRFTSNLAGRTPGARAATGSAVRTPAPRTSTAPQPKRATSHKVPQSTSLTHIRSLTAQMQRLEARVQSARSRLPAPVNTPPSRISPRSSVGVPSTVTIRSRKRTGTSSATSSVAGNDEVTPTNHRTGAPNQFSSSTSSRSHVPRLSTSGVSRLSFGPLPNRNPLDGSESRPSSRASVSSYQIPRPASRTATEREYIPRPASRTATERDSKEIMPPPRPVSRASLGGARTPLGLRPRSSMSGSLHGHSASLSGYQPPPTPDVEDSFDPEMRTPSRRGTYSRYDVDMSSSTSGIPMPSSVRRQSGGIPVPSAGGPGRRTSGGPSGPTLQRRASILEDLGETY